MTQAPTAGPFPAAHAPARAAQAAREAREAELRAAAAELVATHDPAVAAAERHHWLVFTVPERPVAGAECVVYFNKAQSQSLGCAGAARHRPEVLRADSCCCCSCCCLVFLDPLVGPPLNRASPPPPPLRYASQLRLQVGCNKWQLGGEKLPLEPAAAVPHVDGSDFWTVKFTVPHEAFEVNMVFGDDYGSYDNNQVGVWVCGGVVSQHAGANAREAVTPVCHSAPSRQ